MSTYERQSYQQSQQYRSSSSSIPVQDYRSLGRENGRLEKRSHSPIKGLRTNDHEEQVTRVIVHQAVGAQRPKEVRPPAYSQESLVVREQGFQPRKQETVVREVQPMKQPFQKIQAQYHPQMRQQSQQRVVVEQKSRAQQPQMVQVQQGPIRSLSPQPQGRIVQGGGSKVGDGKVRRSRIVEPPPEPKRRVEMVPYEQKYIDYVQQRVKVPVQKQYVDYYQIEHIIDYIPIERYDIVYETEPQEVVDMKLMYVPVETKIIHFSEEHAKREGVDQRQQLGPGQEVNLGGPRPAPIVNGNQEGAMYAQKVEGRMVNPEVKQNYQPGPSRMVPQGYQQVRSSGYAPNGYVQNNYREEVGPRSRTNFVTSEGYDVNENIRQIDQILADSAVRERQRSRIIM